MLIYKIFRRAEWNALQPMEPPDAVVDMDDVVADFQVAQIRDERFGCALLTADARRRRRLEEIPLRVDREVQLFEVEAAR